MHLLPLEKGLTYGPVYSRRLGISLGINILPTAYKLCSFDCLYCHYGYTGKKTLTPENLDFPGVDQILGAVRKALHATPNIDYLTFAGNGEPTLHPHFHAVVSGVRHLRDTLNPKAKLAIFSNASTVHLAQVREVLAKFDTPMMKLDAGDPQTFAMLNRPAPGVTLEQILSGLKAMPRFTIQSALIDGPLRNCDGQAFEAWLAALKTLTPTHVQIYSTDYPVPDDRVQRVLPYILEKIAADTRERTGLPVSAHWA